MNKIKEWFEREYSLKYYEIKCIIIITMLSTFLLVKIWPRLRNDALEFVWYWYVILIVIFSLIWKLHSSNK